AYALYCRRHVHLAVPWRRVFQSSAAMASAVVLATFLAIGLFDSLHYRPQLDQKGDGQKAYATEVLSLLDLGLAHLRGRSEKTYSAPLAMRSYAKEQVELPDGKQMRDYPRLRFGGAHLKDEGDRDTDVAQRALAGLAAGLFLSFLVMFLTGKLKNKIPDIPWHASGAALCALLLL